MEIYIFIGVFLLLITCIAPRDKTVFYFFCILFAMIGLFRSHNVGTDCIAYSSAFRKITLNPNTWNLILPFEPGFNVLCALFKKNRVLSETLIKIGGTYGKRKQKWKSTADQ